MILDSYKKIYKFCDKILLSKESNIYTHSITALHVLKEHPALLSYYIQNTNFEKNKDISLIKKIYFFLKNILIEKKNFQTISKTNKKCDVLLLSSLINKSHLKNSDDFYYGTLERKLNLKGFKTRTVLRNFTDTKTSDLLKIIKNNKIILTKKTNITHEIKIFYNIILQYLFIKKFRIPKISNLNKNFLSFVSLRSMFVNLRLYYQIYYLLKELNPKLIIIPFEGHAWERLIINLVKENFKKIKICSYQFSVITKFQHAIFRPLKKNYNPDVIFTTGKVISKNFIKYKCPVRVLGSNKYKKKIIYNFKKKNTFLVLPESFNSENKILLDFTIDLAKKLPNCKFVFRCHPAVKNSFIQRKIKNIKNIKLSNSTLEVDAIKSKFVIFRASAAVFEAVVKGAIPIYYDLKNEPNINPLYKTFPKKLNVQNANNLIKILKDKKLQNKNKKIINFASNYFENINLNVLISELENR